MEGGGGDGSGEGGGGDGNGDSDAAEVASIAATEAVDEHLVVGDSDKENEEDAAPSEPAAGASGGHAKKRQHVENDVSPTHLQESSTLSTLTALRHSTSTVRARLWPQRHARAIVRA